MTAGLRKLGRSLPELRRALPLAVLAALLLLAPQWIESGYSLDIARLALYSACLAATWSLLAGIAGQFSFAHTALAGIAAYTGAICGHLLPAGGASFGAVGTSILIGALASFALGTALGVVVLRLRGAYLALFTMAFAEIARLVVIAEKEITGGWLSLGIAQMPGTQRQQYYVMLGLMTALLISIYAIMASRVGLFLRAMREDADAAAAMGVDVTRLKVLVFSMTAFLVGLAGGTYFHTIPRLTPGILDLLEMGFIVVYAVVGGLESPLSAAIAAAIMVVLLEALRVIEIGPIRIEPGIWRYTGFGAILVLTLRLAPNGLIAPILRRLAGIEPVIPSPLRAFAELPEGPAMDFDLAPRDRPIDLRVQGIEMRFGGAVALDGVSFALDRPQICGLIGPNGAGKTTLVNLLSGYYCPTGGALFLRGERVDSLPPYEMVSRGIGRTFQITRAFRRLSVLENLLVPELAINPTGTRSGAEERAATALQVLGIDHLSSLRAESLSGGQLKLLELARLLMLDTDILVLDEPFAGVHVALKASVASFVRLLRKQGRAVLLIEHDLTTLFSLCERLIVLDRGAIIADGNPEAVKRDPKVIAAYLGEAANRPRAAFAVMDSSNARGR